MSIPLATGVIVAALVLALLSLINAFRNRPMGVVLLAGLGVLELALLVQAGLAVAGVIAGEGPGERGTLIGYLVGTVLLPPAAVFLGLAERSRWGSAVVVVGAFAVAVMTGRIVQIWQGTA
jgi:hypothetical protein